jgi:hypothetical protein
MNFQDALNHHLNTISNRDLDAFSKTIVNDDRLTLIMPNSTVLNGFDEILAFHKNWFSDPDWNIEANLIKVIESDNTATALLDVTYNDLNEAGKPYQLQYLLSLTFVFENDTWLLVFDQNTMKS